MLTIGKRTTTVYQGRHKNKCILAKQVFEAKQEWNSNINNSVLVKEDEEVNFKLLILPLFLSLRTSWIYMNLSNCLLEITVGEL